MSSLVRVMMYLEQKQAQEPNVHVKDLTSPHPHVMKQHPEVGGSSGLPTTTQSGRSGSAISAEGGQTAM